MKYSRTNFHITKSLFFLTFRMLLSISFASSQIIRDSTGQSTKENDTFHVMKIEENRVYINAGSEEGAATGMLVTLFEPIKGLSKQGVVIEDIIPIAYAPIYRIGEHFSILVLDSATLRLIHLNCPVRLASSFSRPTVVKKEMENKHEEEKEKKTEKAEAKMKENDSTKIKTFEYSVSEFKLGEPVYFQLFVPEEMPKPVVHIRRQGEISYTNVLLQQESPLVFIGKVEKDFHRDNAIEYYIGVKKDTGKENLLVANPVKPFTLAPPKAKEVEVGSKPQEFNPVKLGWLHEPPVGGVMYKKISITVYAPEPMRNPKLRYRQKGKVEYREILLTAKPNSYYYYEIPEEDVVEPAVQYYLTVTNPNGDEVLVQGNPQNPQTIPVTGFVINPSIELQKYRGNRNRLQFLVERVGFYNNDYYQHYEGDYLYRIFTTLYSIKMGMGAFEGKGFGGKDFTIPEKLNYYYGYTEAEMRIPGGGFSLIGRFLTGINNGGIGTGFETKIRAGDEFGVNLVSSVWSASRLGTSGSVQLNVPVTDRWGFSGLIAVEDLPVKGQTGFRLAVDVRKQVADDLEVSGRVGMGARSTSRVGANVGLGIIRHF